jgi:hypothetical protein
MALLLDVFVIFLERLAGLEAQYRPEQAATHRLRAIGPRRFQGKSAVRSSRDDC